MTVFSQGVNQSASGTDKVNAILNVHLASGRIGKPGAGWLEKDGTVTNSERRISRQRPLLAPPGEARPDWWIVSQVAQRMGYRDAFAYTHPAQVFAEHAALSAFENDGRRDFDLEGLTGLSEAAYDDQQPVQWPVRRAGERGEQRFFANGGFSTPDRRARLIPVTLPAPRAPAHPDALVLNTGRVRDHWHTMTRTGRSARLCAHVAEPCAELHPRDAQRRGIGDGDLVRLHNNAGDLLLRARIVPAQRAGSVFVPMHWSDAFASRARVNTLVAAHTDPISGQPALKQASVLAQRVAASWHGFAVTRLLGSAMSAATPVAVGASVSRPEQRIWRSTLATLAAGVLRLPYASLPHVPHPVSCARTASGCTRPYPNSRSQVRRGRCGGPHNCEGLSSCVRRSTYTCGKPEQHVSPFERLVHRQ